MTKRIFGQQQLTLLAPSAQLVETTVIFVSLVKPFHVILRARAASESHIPDHAGLSAVSTLNTKSFSVWRKQRSIRQDFLIWFFGATEGGSRIPEPYRPDPND
ncbi:MAG: hypothetical protein KGL39_38890 [Patescibacteria group bacterium]|nr:hypothetical protein [Patescibacteria group bacterium]